MAGSSGAGSSGARPSATKDMLITRTFAAPPGRVFRAFTDPGQLARWFGPVGYSVPLESVQIDLRVGGHQRFVMVSDSDPRERSAVDAEFTEIIANELIVGVESWEGVPELQDPTNMHLRLEFHDEGGSTRLVVRQGSYTEEVEQMAREGWNSSFTKLDELLAGS